MKDPKTQDCETPVIIAGRWISAFSLIGAGLGHINKQELTHAKPVYPLQLFFSDQSPNQDPGTIHPSHQNGALKKTYTRGCFGIIESSVNPPHHNARSLLS